MTYEYFSVSEGFAFYFSGPRPSGLNECTIGNKVKRSVFVRFEIRSDIEDISGVYIRAKIDSQ
jgi:hypothetical protein